MSDRASASWLPDGPAAGQGQAHQQRWEPLWDDIVKKGEKTPAQLQPERGVRRCETALQTARSVKKEGEGVLQAPEQRFPCSPWRRPW